MLHALLALALLTTAAVPPPGATLELPAGTPLRQLASPVAPPVTVLPETAPVVVLEHHGGWVRVRWSGVTGWVERWGTAGGAGQREGETGGATIADAPPAGRLPVAPDPALDEARRRLGTDLRAGHLGPFELLTDVADESLLERLDRMTGGLVPLFAERYGLRPDGRSADPAAQAGWTVVLFAQSDDYRTFTDHVARATGRDPADLDYVGHAVGRLAFLSADAEVERLLRHEAAHLLLRRTLGGDPPVWLDEGIAGDMEMMAMDDRGRLLSTRLIPGGMPRHRLLRRSGPLARLSDLAEAARRRRLPAVVGLLELSRAELARSPRRPDLYALAALLVRYLLEGAGSDVAERFRAYLAAGAEGGLPAALGLSETELQRGFEGWLIDVQMLLAVGGR